MASRTEITRAELFVRLARGHVERIVVLTPNRRLAQALEAEFDRTCLARGLGSWEAPDILPFPAFLVRACATAARFVRKAVRKRRTSAHRLRESLGPQADFFEPALALAA